MLNPLLLLSTLLLVCLGEDAPSLYASASKSIDGVQYDYTNINGEETLRVQGTLHPNFDKESILKEFRISLGLAKNSDTPSNERKTLFESFTNFFVGTEFGSHVSQYYQTLTRGEVEQQIGKARLELREVDDDLSAVLTQEKILKHRQAELGRWLAEDMAKPVSEQFATVRELVTVEDDRLTLLETRLSRIRAKLVKEKAEFEQYINIQSRSSSLTSDKAEVHTFYSNQPAVVSSPPTEWKNVIYLEQD
jgi:hypothetical protein